MILESRGETIGPCLQPAVPRRSVAVAGPPAAVPAAVVPPVVPIPQWRRIIALLNQEYEQVALAVATFNRSLQAYPVSRGALFRGA